MKKTYIVFGLFILISVLWLLNDWQSGDWRKGLSQNAEPELQAIEPGESPGLSFSASSGYKEFVSSDGKLKIKYPNSWLAVANQGLFTAASPEEWREKYNLETVFLAQIFKADKFAQLMVQEGIFDISAGEIIEEMKQINQEQELNMEIVKSDIQDDKTVFEARYLMTNNPNVYSKEEIISLGEKTYLIAFIALEKDWPEFTKEADAVLESVEIIP